MARLFVANLDCEQHWAAQHCPGPFRQIPLRVREAVSAASVHMAALARPGDTLWTMELVPGARVPEGVRTCSGRVDELSAFDAVIPWGQTEPWVDASLSAVAARCNDRRFGQRLSELLRCALPSSRVLASLAELDEQLANPSTVLGPSDSWVVKAPFSASGRERLKRRGRQLEGELRVRAERLFSSYGELVFEPWLDRVLDLGVVGQVGSSIESSSLHPAHELINDDTGVFRAIRIDQDLEMRLGVEMHHRLEQVSAAVIVALHDEGYRGPFGIDAFVYRDGDEERLHPLCEINARYTFGHIAHALGGPCFEL